MNNEYTTPTPAPVPVSVSEGVEEAEEITANDIFQEVISINKEGYSPCSILAEIEMLKNVTAGEDTSDIPEERREEVQDLEIEFCKADILAIDNDIVDLKLRFDSPEDAFRVELLEMLDKYVEMMKSIDQTDDPFDLPMFSIAFAPDRFQGHGILSCAFPVSYFATLDENDEATCIDLIFHAENINCELISMSEDDLSNLQAEIMREMEDRDRLDEAYH